MRSAFETDQEKHPALLLVNSREGAIEIPQRQQLCRIGCRCGDWPRFVDPDDNAFPHAAMDAVCNLVVHEGEEPGAEIGTALPEMLLRNCADKSVLDEIVGPGHVAGQRKSTAPQARDFCFEKSTEIVHLRRLCSWQSTSRMVRLTEVRRRNLDYSKAQSFQDLLLCRSLRTDPRRASCRPRRVVADFGIGSSNPSARPFGARTW